MKINSSSILRKIQCPRCASKGGDTRRDNLVIYLNSDRTESAHCFVCGYTIASTDFKKKYGIQERKEITFVATDYSAKDWERDIVNYTSDPNGYRKLRKATCIKYRVKHKIDTVSGDVKEQLYPVTKDYQFSGVKKRIVLEDGKKTFSSDGSVSKHCDLFGENVFKDAHLSQRAGYRTVILTSGELDAMTVYQMLDDDNQARNKKNGTDYPTVPVLSGVVGELGNVNQYKLKYDFLDQFDNIVYIPDKDEAGEDALHSLALGLPKDKLFIVNLPSGYKDPTEMLEKKKQAEFIKAYWDKSAYNPAGIVGSSSLKEKMKQDLMTPKVPLPDFMIDFQKMLAGGFKVESIINIGAASGAGKSTLVNEMIYYWIFNSPYKVGIISLELSAPQYGVALGSRHLGKKLSLYENGEEAIAFLELPENDSKLDVLYKTSTGLDRFHLVDERDGGIEAVKKLVEKLIISCDCKVIILDPLQDVMAGLSVGEQEEFLAWMKSTIKRFGIIFININHVRKSGNGSEANSAGAMITEEDFAGSSTIFKSASVNLLFTRNKYLSDDNPYKNVIHSYASKNRNTGLTGDAGDYYYDNSSHTLYELEFYKTLNPRIFAEWEAKEQAEKDKIVDEAKVKYGSNKPRETAY